MSEPGIVFPRYTRAERKADLFVHLFGVPAGIVGGIHLLVLAVPRDEPLRLAALALYGAALAAMLVFSAAYNLTESPRRKEVLRRLDHAAIFVMIAGTYTPFMLVALEAGWAVGFCVFVWLVAALGVFIKLCYPRRFERVSLAIYLLLGWSAVAVAQPLFAALPPPILGLLLAGGVLYTVGVVFHTARRLRYHNAIWHALVLAAAALHYVAVLKAVGLPGAAIG